MNQDLLERALKRIDELEKRLNIYYQMLKIENELDFIMSGSYYVDELDQILNGTY